MSLSRTAFPMFALILLLSPADIARAAGIDDANSAVIAARNGKYDDAIRLFGSAINSDELNLTGRAQAYAYRGIAKATIGDYAGAQEDLDFAVALQSDYAADAYAYRGYFEMVSGDAHKAAADLAKSAELKIWPYNVLWLSLARAKANIPDTDDHSVKANAARLDLTQWPGPVVKFLMGEEKPEAVATDALAGDPAKVTERTCDADFYTAEYDLSRNQAAAAQPLLQRAAEKCPFASFERMGATAELMRLK